MVQIPWFLNEKCFKKKPPTKAVVYTINHFSGSFIALAIDIKSALTGIYYKQIDKTMIKIIYIN